MLRTCAVEVGAHDVDRSRSGSFQVPATPGHDGLDAEAALRCRPSARDARHLPRRTIAAGSTIALMASLSCRILSPRTVHGDLLGEVPVGDGDRDLGDVAGPARSGSTPSSVTLSVEVLPRPRRRRARAPGPPSLPSVPTSSRANAADFRRGKAFNWSTIVLMVFLSSRISPLTSHRDLARQVAARDRGSRRRRCCGTWPVRFEAIEVDVVGEVLPGAADAGHFRLAAELALGGRPRARDPGSPSAANERSCSTIVFMVSLSCRNLAAHVRR